MPPEALTEDQLERYRPLKIWRALGAEKRKELAEAFWTSDSIKDMEKAAAVETLAAAMRFRPQTIRTAPAAKRAAYLASCNVLNDQVVGSILFVYHMDRQVPMMTKFLDALGIQHEEGRIEEAFDPPSTETLEKAVADLLRVAEEEDVVLYLRTLVSQDDENWAGLVPILEAREA